MKKILLATFLLVILSSFSISVCAQSESRESLLSQIETKRAELATLESQYLAPSDEDRAAYAEFLKQPDSGLIRLLPREVFDKESKLTTRGGGAYYSFTRRTHAYGRGSDIELQQKYLSVGFAGTDYGILLNIGDIQLDEIGAEHPAGKVLSTHVAAADEPQARVEQRRFATGTTIDGVVYKDRALLQVNATYLLRSINYSNWDVLVAFRVVRQDVDGSAIILWKLVKKYPKPELARTNQASNAQ
jgi:hypothetical protein